jgi:pimeloyl-ACP methyl ester carboxylesterase
MRPLRPLLGVLAHAPTGRGAVLGGLRALPWLATEDEARSALAGFADSTDFWRLLWWAIMADLPTGLNRVRCPVTLAQGTVDLLAGGQTPRYLLTVPGARFASLAGEGHSPMSDTPATIVELVTETVRRAGAAAPGPSPDRHDDITGADITGAGGVRSARRTGARPPARDDGEQRRVQRRRRE